MRNFQRNVARIVRENRSHPSRFELARRGNFQAIAYWLNQSLIPAGIYASVGASRHGCVGIWVELPPLESNNWYLPTLQRQVVQFICHQIWKLNSEAIDGVRIVARLAGQRRILWEQSVRIVTPASRSRYEPSTEPDSSPPTPWNDTYDTVVRTVPIVGTATLAFLFGFWATARHRQPSCEPPCAAQPSTSVSPPSHAPKVVETIEVGGEKVAVVAPEPLSHSDPLDVTLFLTPEVGLPQGSQDQEGLTSADVTMVNWSESQMGEERTAELVAAGVDLVDVVSEEAMAQEGALLAQALETLDRAGLPYVGAGRDEIQARRPTILEVKDRRIAYFAYATAEALAAKDERVGLNFSDRHRMTEQIQAIRDRVDWVVVNLHWDGELGEIPDPWQVDLARLAIDSGADLVVGYHPQVMQGGEIYRDRPIVYALSDLIDGSPSADAPSTLDVETAALRVSLNMERLKLEIVPVAVGPVTAPMTAQERQSAILETFEARSATFERPLPLSTLLPLQPEVEPSSVPQSPEILENGDAAPDAVDLDRREQLGEPPQELQYRRRAAPEVEFAPDGVPSPEDSDPFLDEPFISPPQDSQNSDRRKLWEFPRLRLPFEPTPSPAPDARSDRRALDLPSFVKVASPMP